MATDARDTLAEIASIDLLYAILERITAEAGRSMASFIAADEAKLAIWRAKVAEVRSSLAQRQATGPARVYAIILNIAKTAMIENMLAASIPPIMAARTEALRVGTECGSRCTSRGSSDHERTKKKKSNK